MEYVPIRKSLFFSLLWSLWPVIIAGTTTYFMYESIHWFLWVADAVMISLSLFLVAQTLFIHTQKLYLDDYQIKTSNFLCVIPINWSQITKAVLRERVNAMSRIDRLLLIEAPGHIISFNTSTLSPENEEIALNIVRKKTNLIVVRDTPSI